MESINKIISILDKTEWILVTKEDYDLEVELASRRSDNWIGHRKTVQNKDTHTELEAGDYVCFLQVGKETKRAIYGYGILAATPREDRVKIRYSYEFKWDLIRYDSVQEFLNEQDFDNSVLRDRLTYRQGSHGFTYIGLTDNDRKILIKMFKKFQEPDEATKDSLADTVLDTDTPTKTEILREMKQRVGQVKNRKNAEKNYPDGCALCKPPVTEPDLLIASHIKHWADCKPDEKYDPANVIRLCACHDKLFERGYLRLTDNLETEFSSKLSLRTVKTVYEFTSWSLSDAKIKKPLAKYLQRHRRDHAEMEPYTKLNELEVAA